MIAADVVDHIVDRAQREPSRTALEEAGGQSLTGAELARRVVAVSHGLRAAGLREGDGVLFAVRPSSAAIVLILGTLRAGGVLVAADLGMSEALFRSRMALARPRWVVAESVLMALARWSPLRALLRRRGTALPPLTELPAAGFVRVGRRWPGVPRALDYERLISASHVQSLPAPAGEAAAFVVFTSGTTAAPRAVVHTQASLGASVGVLSEALALRREHVLYSGELHAIVPGLVAGARVVIPPRRGGAGQLVQDARRFGVTHVFGTPSDFAQLGPAQCLPHSVSHVFLGAAPVERSFLRRLQAAVAPATEVWSVYAMTEMLPVARVRMQDKLADTGLGDLVGAPFPGVRARVAPDGELLLRGPHLFRGYLGEAGPKVAEHATGDLATLDAHGRLVLLGRKKDMIIRGHDNIYPALHEPLIAEVRGVRRCCLVGAYSDTLADEQVVLVVEPEPGHDRFALEQRVRRAVQGLDAAAQPDLLVFDFVPLSGRSHKVDRRAVLERLRASHVC